MVDGLQGDKLAEALSPRLTPSLAKFVSDNFTIVSHTEGSHWLGSSFDGTVWRGNAGTPYANKTYVSMRGTQELPDFVADLDLATNSAARAEIADMVNWWLRITTPVGQMATQIALVNIPVPILPSFFVPALSVSGTGELAGVSHVEVNGHSLGGHLASAFARIFGNQLGIDHVTTFNSAGFIITSEPVFQNIALILDTGATQFHNNAQTNFYAEHGIDVTTNNWYFSQIGQRVPLFNEEGTGIPNHLMYKLTDALALADVMSTLDGNLNLPVITALLDAGSAQPASSLENILDELRKILLNQTNKTQIGDTGDSADSRKDYHIKLDGLRTFANVHTNGYRIDPLFSKSRDDLTSLAKGTDANALAVRYALKELNPFAVFGVDYSAFNTAGQLDLYDPATNAGEMTKEYLADRAAFLTWKNKLATEDFDGTTGAYSKVPDAYFKDLGSNLLINLGSGGSLTDKPRDIFGADQASGATENLTGGSKADRLYGGGGMDVLNGDAGDDYLEGNSGDTNIRHANGDASSICRIFFGQALNESEWRVTA